MADENIDINIKVQLKEANAELIRARDSFGDLSKEALAAAQKVGTLKERIGDARQQADAFTDGGKFKALTGTLSGIAGGFSAIQGAIGLVSNDSKALQETMLKVQSAMALTQGLTALAELGDAFKTLKTAAISSFNAIKAGLTSSGIGAILVAVGVAAAALIGYFSALTEEEEKNKSITDELKDSHDALKLSFSEEADVIVRRYNLLAEKSKQRGDDAASQLRIQREMTTELIALGRDEMLSLVAQRDEYIAYRDALKTSDDDYAQKKQEFDGLIKTSESEIASQRKTNLDLKNRQELLSLQLEGEANKKSVDGKKTTSGEKIEIEEEEVKKLTELEQAKYDLGKETIDKIEDLNKKELNKTKTKKQIELDDIEIFYQKKFDLAIGDIETTKNLEILKAEELKAIKEKYALEEKELIAKKKEQEDEEKERQEKERQETQDKIDAKVLSDKQAVADTTIAIAETTFNTISQLRKNDLDKQLSDLEQQKSKELNVDGLTSDQKYAIELSYYQKSEELKAKAFEQNKRMQIVMAVIDAAKMVTSTLGQFPKFDGGIAMAAALIAQGAAISAQIDIISSQKYIPGTAPSKGGSEGKGSKFANGGLLEGPSHQFGGIKTAMGELEGGEFVINKRSTSAFLPLLQALNDQGRTDKNMASSSSTETPIFKTYVVASEMSSQQEANKRVNDLAKL